jgi:ubiquinone/menaquinone biosynthesis C-methylase UbiE
MARGYARQPISNPEAYRYKLDKTASHLAASDRVLEFGCGTGSTALIHASRVAHIDAIDFSSKMIAIARHKARDLGVANVRFEISSFEDWPLPEPGEGYDAVLGMSILHLVDDLGGALARVRRTLKPGGMFFSSTACMERLGGVARYLMPPLGAIGILPKVRLLTPEMLTQEMSAQGLTVEHVWQPKENAAVFVVARRPD